MSTVFKGNFFAKHSVCAVHKMPPAVAVFSRCAAAGRRPRTNGDVCAGGLWDEDFEQPVDFMASVDGGMCYIPFLSTSVTTPGAVAVTDAPTPVNAGFVPTAYDMTAGQRAACGRAAVSYLAPPVPPCKFTE